MPSWGKKTVSFLRVSFLLKQDCSCGRRFGERVGSYEANLKRRSEPMRKYLEGKARDMANQEEWVPFADALALLIFGVVLFPNVDGLVDLSTIDAFLAYHHSK